MTDQHSDGAPPRAQGGAAWQALQALACPYNEQDHGPSWQVSAHAWDEAIIAAMRAVDGKGVAREAWQRATDAEEVRSLHRQLAAEKLRADQGWARAEAKSKECIALRERMAQAARAVVPEDWQLVPKEPTQDMCANGFYEFSQDRDDVDAANLWRAMLRAAPAPAAAQEGEHGSAAAEVLNVMLWMYRRLTHAYGRPPFIEHAINILAKKTGTDVAGYFAERDTGAGGSTQAAPAGLRDAEPDDEALRDAVIEGLRGLYGCGRVWSAWSFGTMTEGDFYPADESDECIVQVMDAIRALRSTSAQPLARQQ
jgi:hypothetical protein